MLQCPFHYLVLFLSRRNAAAAGAAATHVIVAASTITDIAAAAAGVSLSPLQRMASITNSLVTQNTMAGGGGHGNRPLRAVLPPITQQQFDQFSHLNTDETVRRVSTENSLQSEFFIGQQRYLTALY